MRILVLGIGNILLSDEGVGVHVVRRLEEGYELPANVGVVDGGTSGMDLLDMVAECDHLLIVDCARLDEKPGAIRVYEGQAVPAFFQSRISPHQIGLSDLMAALVLMDALPNGLTLIGIQPESIELGTELTAAGELACKAALAPLIARLGELGAPPVPRAVEAA